MYAMCGQVATEYPAYPDDAEVPEGMTPFDFHVHAASEIRSAGNDLFRQVLLRPCNLLKC